MLTVVLTLWQRSAEGQQRDRRGRPAGYSWRPDSMNRSVTGHKEEESSEKRTSTSTDKDLVLSRTVHLQKCPEFVKLARACESGGRSKDAWSSASRMKCPISCKRRSSSAEGQG